MSPPPPQPKLDQQTSQNQQSGFPAQAEDFFDPNGEGKKKPFWAKRGVNQVSKKVRRQMQNARLRKLLLPKNALMILYELYPELKCVVHEQTSAINQAYFTVTVTVDNKQFHGQAISKTGAKQVACENALRGILLEKMGKALQDHKVSDANISNINKSNTECEGDEPMDEDKKQTREKNTPKDDVPWGSLASFALYKLFMEWQNQGIQVPIVSNHVSLGSATPMAPMAVDKPFQQANCLRPMKKIPEDANKQHPVQLLNQLKPGAPYTVSCSGLLPNLTYSVSVLVDGEEFVGTAGNKKNAKRECAKAALLKMGVVYD